MWWLIIGIAVVALIAAVAKSDYEDKIGLGQKKYCNNCDNCKDGRCHHSSNIRMIDTPFEQIKELKHEIHFLNKNNDCLNYYKKYESRVDYSA